MAVFAAEGGHVAASDARLLIWACTKCSASLEESASGQAVAVGSECIHGKCLSCADCGKAFKAPELGAARDAIKCRSCSPPTGGGAESEEATNIPAAAGDPANAEICPACVKQVSSGARLALGKTWHPNCWACERCRKAITTPLFYVLAKTAGEPHQYCQNCFFTVRAEM